MPSTSASELENYGNIASDAYIHKQVPLNQTIIKIASENKLNREQIQRVCEFANLRAFDDQVKTAKDKRFEFPLADFKEVVAQVKNVPDIETKEASVKNDLSKLGFYREKGASINPISGTSELFMEAKSTMDKLASANQPLTQTDVVANFMKLGEYKDKLRLAEIEYESNDYEIKEAMSNMVKDMVQDGHKFEDLYKAAVASVPADKTASIKNLFEDVGERLKKAGVIQHYKLAFDRMICMAHDILKLAEIKSSVGVEAGPGGHPIKNLKARNAMEMVVGRYLDNQHCTALTKATREHYDEYYEKIRGLVKDKIGKMGQEEKELK